MTDKVLPLQSPCHYWALLLPLFLLLGGCGTTQTYVPRMSDLPPKPADYPIPLYAVGVPLPRPCQVIGQVAIGDTQLTMKGGSFQGVMKTLMDTAHEKGADAVQLVVLEKPDYSSTHFRLQANLLHYAAAWETVMLSPTNFLIYLQQHRQTLDPIEGIWSDGSPEFIGIIKDASRPGREFIAFTPDPGLASWHPGYKKMDIAHMQRAGVYSVTYYRDDFVSVKTGLLLEQNRAFHFNLPAGDREYSVSFSKLVPPVPAK